MLAALACVSCAAPQVRPVSVAAKAPVVTATGALSAARGDRIIERRLAPHQDTERVRAMVDAFREQAQAPLVAGNHVGLLVDGPQTLGAVRRAIEAAQRCVYVETYIFAADDIGKGFSDLLIRRSQEGLDVRVLYDAVGSITTPAAFFDSMRNAGVDVLPFRPLDPIRTPLAWKINNRDHRKLVILDNRVAFTGGINISGAYASSSATRPGPKQGQDKGWRDTHVEIEGPVAEQFQKLFLDTWSRAGGKAEAAAQDCSTPQPAGSELVAAVASDGGDPDEATIYATYLATIRHASQRVWITQAYFAPNKELIEVLIAAAKRGVDVRLIVPGFTDSALIFHASRASYDKLLAAGVRLYEQRNALLHAKTAVIDTTLSMVGSANLDMRSFLHNNEVNAVVVGSEFAQRMEELFERDVQESHELDLRSWRKRSFMNKLKEFGSGLFSYWL
jgi:cardiolipin synthase A/B